MEECRDCSRETSVQRVLLPDGREIRALACAECPWRTSKRDLQPFSLEAFLGGIAPAGPAPEPESESDFGEAEDPEPSPLPEPTPFPTRADAETALWRAAALAPLGFLLVLFRNDAYVVLVGLLGYGALGASSGLLGPGCEREQRPRTLARTAALACLLGVLVSGLVLSVLDARGMTWAAWTELGGSLAGKPVLRIAIWSVVVGLVIGSAVISGELSLRRESKDSDFREQLTVMSLAALTWGLGTLLTLDLTKGARCGVAAYGLAYVSSEWWPKLCRAIQAVARYLRPATREVWWAEEPTSEEGFGDTLDELLTPTEVAARLAARSLVVGLVWLCLVLAFSRGTARAVSQGSSLALLIGVCSLTELWCAGRVTRLWRLASLMAVVTALAIGGALLNSHYLFGTWSGGILAGVGELSTALDPGAWGSALLPATLIWGPLWFVATARASGAMDYREAFALLAVHVVAFVAVLTAVRGQDYLPGLMILALCDVLGSGLLIWIYEFADRVAIYTQLRWRASREAGIGSPS